MPTKLPLSEFQRRLCVASHHGEFIPGPAGGVPCSEHKRFGQLYYGLLDEHSFKMVEAIYSMIRENADAG